MGIVSIFGEETLDGSCARRTFRSVLALTLIPQEYVRRGIALIIGEASEVMAPFLAYVARSYIGLSQMELDRGAEAFVQNEDSRLSSISIRRTHGETPSLADALTDHTYSRSISFGTLSPRPSTQTMTSSRRSSVVVPRWEMPIVRRPRFEVPFWNVFDRAQSQIEKTNNAMESSYKHFAKELNHHPSLSDFLHNFMEDVDKQNDIARSATMHNTRRRRKQYVVKEEAIAQIHQEADFDGDRGLMDALFLLGLKLQGYVGGLHVRREQSDEDSTGDSD